MRCQGDIQIKLTHYSRAYSNTIESSVWLGANIHSEEEGTQELKIFIPFLGPMLESLASSLMYYLATVTHSDLQWPLVYMILFGK